MLELPVLILIPQLLQSPAFASPLPQSLDCGGLGPSFYPIHSMNLQLTSLNTSRAKSLIKTLLSCTMDIHIGQARVKQLDHQHSLVNA